MDRRLTLAGCVLLTGCVLGTHDRRAIPATTEFVRGPLIVGADFALDERHQLLDDLIQHRERIAATLDLPLSPQPVELQLFASPERYYAVVARRFPQFPARRAFFIKQGGRLEVYAQWTERVAEDLRHETTHALLHATLDDLPLWLDEGLAEFFETPVETGGWNAPHVALLRQELYAGRWRPNLERLEMLPATAEMTQLDYAEAWGWTYLLLQTTPARRALLRHHLSALRHGAETLPLGELLHRAETSPADDLVAMLTHAQK